MFPGYIFGNRTGGYSFAKLKQIPDLTKILGDGTEFIPLTQEEVIFLKIWLMRLISQKCQRDTS